LYRQIREKTSVNTQNLAFSGRRLPYLGDELSLKPLSSAAILVTPAPGTAQGAEQLRELFITPIVYSARRKFSNKELIL
jgi:hypothetical protein